jgi:hypothetical protein
MTKNSLSVVTGDKTCVYRCQPETKQQFSEWKRPSSPRLKKARQVRLNIKSIPDDGGSTHL